MSTIARFLIFDAALCSATGNVSSTGIPVQSASGNFAVALAASTSAATIDVTYEASGDGTNYDTTTTSPSRTIITGLAKNEIVKGFDLPVCKKLKIKCTGTGSNPAGTTVTGRLMFSE